jgi:hypothetical protein
VKQVDLEEGGRMAKFFTMAVLMLLLSAVFSSSNAASKHIAINLNDPDVLDMLKRSNPKHYAKVCEIMRGLFWRSDDTVPRWIRTNFDAREVRYPPILLTSYPAKRRLSFILDDASYEATVTLRGLPIRY